MITLYNITSCYSYIIAYTYYVCIYVIGVASPGVAAARRRPDRLGVGVGESGGHPGGGGYPAGAARHLPAFGAEPGPALPAFQEPGRIQPTAILPPWGRLRRQPGDEPRRVQPPALRVVRGEPGWPGRCAAAVPAARRPGGITLAPRGASGGASGGIHGTRRAPPRRRDRGVPRGPDVGPEPRSSGALPSSRIPGHGRPGGYYYYYYYYCYYY